MSSSPNGLRPQRATDRRTPSENRANRGIFFVITFISIPALPLYDQVLNHHHFIAGGGGDLRVEVGALFEITTLIAGVGTAVALYPVLRRRSEGLALGYVTVRVVESALIAVGIVSLLAVMTLRQGLAGTAGTDNASLILNGRSLVAVHDAASCSVPPSVPRWAIGSCSATCVPLGTRAGRFAQSAWSPAPSPSLPRSWCCSAPTSRSPGPRAS